MSKLYKLKPEAEEHWKEKLSPDVFQQYMNDGFDIDVIVDLSKEWDVALQKVLKDVTVIRDEA